MSRATSSASTCLFLMVAAGAGAAQESTAAVTIPPGLERRVAERIAEVWDVPWESLRLQWGRLALQQPLNDTMPVRLIGRGADGWFAATITLGSGTTTAVRVRAGREDTVYVAARPLESGSELAPGDVEPKVRIVWRRPEAGETVRPEMGWLVRRPIGAGQELRFPAVSRPYVISAGEPVQFTWRRGTVAVSMTGVALNAARIGDRVRARVSGRSTHVAGIATGPGTARLKGGGR